MSFIVFRTQISISSAYLRQSILLSAFETPEIRSLYNTSLQNVAGKVRTEKRWPAVAVPEGIEQVCDQSYSKMSISNIPQNFVHFDCISPKDEADKRFHHFTTQVRISDIMPSPLSNGLIPLS